MRPHSFFHLLESNFILLFSLIFLGNTFSAWGQHDGFQIQSIRDWAYAYKGWWGHPDNIKIWIDPSFTEDQKEKIRQAYKRWNDAGAHPKYVEAGPSEAANVTIIRNDNLSVNGFCNNVWLDMPNGRYIVHSFIYIDTDDSLGVLEIATHELGHAQGLLDTKNKEDAMVWIGTNEHQGALSPHDRAELWGGMTYSWIPMQLWATAPPTAIPPGMAASVVFDLTGYYPPEILLASAVNVSPCYDSLLFVSYTVLTEEFLEVGITTDITHPDCTMSLIINLYPPEPYDSLTFIGLHYINEYPVPPIEFECPFEVNEENGNVRVNWTELCTYPFEGELRSELVVDDTLSFLNKGGGDYVIQLAPGNHFFELFVDDFQVNSAYASQFFIVTGMEYPEMNPSRMIIIPNPFTEKCTITCSDLGDIRIYDLYGKVVDHMVGVRNEWEPSVKMMAGVYLVRALVNGQQIEQKMVYLGQR